MEIKLSDHFSFRRLFRFVIPSIVMMIFTSIYGVVDGFFVSNYVGKTEFAAVNLIMPFPMLLGGFGFMIGTGGSALVAMKLGEGKKKEANEIFSMLIKVTIIVGVILSVLGIIFTRNIAIAMGATEDLLEHCVTYGRILLVAITAFMLQNVFQSFLVTAEKPKLGLIITIAAGLTNVVLDFVLIGVLRWGVVGAALATGVSQFVGGLIPLIYFLRENNSELKLVTSKINFRILGKTCFNGSSELMTNISMSIVNMLYNLQLMEYAGENGVAAYGVIMYVNFIFVAVFLGYSIGSAPIIGYNYGAGNSPEMKNVFKKSIGFNIFAGILMCIAAVMLSGVLAGIFVGYDAELFEMTRNGFAIYSLSFLVMGLNIYGSSFFTALGNGLVSAIISFLRTLLFQIAAVLILPIIFELNGIWMSIIVAEIMALVVTVSLFVVNRKKYGY
ncbi:MAG: MATE family efflux transporter [Lachnospiraceae bacterium]|nr:MATE family efflux transporter [Lachnospiraceae bacterium]